MNNNPKAKTRAQQSQGQKTQIEQERADAAATAYLEGIQAAADSLGSEILAFRRKIEQQTADIEWLMTERWNMLHSPAGCLSARDEIARLALMRCQVFPTNQAAEGTMFLGLNPYQWMEAPHDLLALLGLLGTVMNWRKQMAAQDNPELRFSEHPMLH